MCVSTRGRVRARVCAIARCVACIPSRDRACVCRTMASHRQSSPPRLTLAQAIRPPPLSNLSPPLPSLSYVMPIPRDAHVMPTLSHATPIPPRSTPKIPSHTNPTSPHLTPPPPSPAQPNPTQPNPLHSLPTPPRQPSSNCFTKGVSPLKRSDLRTSPSDSTVYNLTRMPLPGARVDGSEEPSPEETSGAVCRVEVCTRMTTH